MRFKSTSSNLSYFYFPSLFEYDKLFHAVFSRKGGFSAPPFDNLNTSFQSEDNPVNVRKNLRLIQEVTNAENLVFNNQVHGDNVTILRNEDNPDLKTVRDADAIITDIADIAIMVKQADCQGVILFDSMKSVVGIIHCGWRGNVINILGTVVDLMKHEFDCRESDISAGIGPSLGPCCGEFKTYREIFPAWFTKYMNKENYFDLWEISIKQLIEVGIYREKIEVAGICTRCNTDIFYSHRAEGTTGRFATVAMLRE